MIWRVIIIDSISLLNWKLWREERESNLVFFLLSDISSAVAHLRNAICFVSFLPPVPPWPQRFLSGIFCLLVLFSPTRGQYWHSDRGTEPYPTATRTHSLLPPCAYWQLIFIYIFAIVAVLLVHELETAGVVEESVWTELQGVKRLVVLNLVFCVFQTPNN